MHPGEAHPGEAHPCDDGPVQPSQTRPPAVAGRFYPGGAAQLRESVEQLLAHAEGTPSHPKA